MNIYVVADGGGWSVKRGASTLSVIATHCVKDDAIAFARVIARAERAEVIVIDESGAEHHDIDASAYAE
jgi:hypothetical protein